MTSRVGRILLWYGYLAALVLVILPMCTKATWGESLFVNASVGFLFWTAVLRVANHPPRWIDPNGRGVPLDYLGAAAIGMGVALAGSELSESLRIGSGLTAFALACILAWMRASGIVGAQDQVSSAQ